MAHARDVLQVFRSNLGVDRIVRDEAGHALTVTALAPDVADLDQGTMIGQSLVTKTIMMLCVEFLGARGTSRILPTHLIEISLGGTFPLFTAVPTGTTSGAYRDYPHQTRQGPIFFASRGSEGPVSIGGSYLYRQRSSSPEHE